MKISLASPQELIDDEQIEAVIRVLKSGQYILGENVKAFEEEFAQYIGTKYAVATSSGTTALHLALLAYGISPGDEVITAPNSFIASSNAIIYVGAKPVFTDVDPEIYNIDPNKIKEKITPKTKAIIPVHLYGHPADMDPIREIATAHNLRIIEDVCQALGANYRSRKVGSLGEAACFSFYPSKNLFVGTDGGMITTDNERVAEKVRALRNYGQTARYEHPILGYNFRLNELPAAIGRINLKRLDSWNKHRREVAKVYNEYFEGRIILPVEKEWAQHVYHLYVIRVTERDKVMSLLEKNGVNCLIHYPIPIHLQKFYRESYGFHEGMFPVTERLAKEILSLPSHPAITNNQAQYVAEKTIEAIKQ